MSSYDWMDEAKCAFDPEIQEQLYRVREGTGSDPFFGKPESHYGLWAKQYCSDCPVKLACLAEAMKSLNGPQIERLDGIWGGMTARSRSHLHRKQKKQIQEISARMKELFQASDTRTEGEVA